MTTPFSYTIPKNHKVSKNFIVETEHTNYLDVIRQWSLCYPSIRDYAQNVINQNRTFTYDEFYAMHKWVTVSEAKTTGIPRPLSNAEIAFLKNKYHETSLAIKVIFSLFLLISCGLSIANFVTSGVILFVLGSLLCLCIEAAHQDKLSDPSLTFAQKRYVAKTRTQNFSLFDDQKIYIQQARKNYVEVEAYCRQVENMSRPFSSLDYHNIQTYLKKGTAPSLFNTTH